MSIVARQGKPDLFITFTTNPSWPELTEILAYPLKFESSPDLVCRVFNAKLTDFLNDIVEKQVFGDVNYNYVIEFQKRGLPHARLLIAFTPENKITIENVDDIICA